MRLAAPSRIDRHVRNAEVPFKRARIYSDILDVFKGYRRFVNDPNASADTQTAISENVPRRIVTKMNSDIGNDIGNYSDRNSHRREPQGKLGSENEESEPARENCHINDDEHQPELEFQVKEKTFGRPEGPAFLVKPSRR
jgi:hypothetical protein